MKELHPIRNSSPSQREKLFLFNCSFSGATALCLCRPDYLSEDQVSCRARRQLCLETVRQSCRAALQRDNQLIQRCWVWLQRENSMLLRHELSTRFIMWRQLPEKNKVTQVGLTALEPRFLLQHPATVKDMPVSASLPLCLRTDHKALATEMLFNTVQLSL